MKKIYLSPSDQIRNLYAAGGTNEAVQCRKIAAACKSALERCGFEVRTNFADGSNAMYERIRESNAWGADLHVCIHTNAGGGRGCVVFVSRLPEREPLARPVFEALDEITPYHSVYGIREAKYSEITKTKAQCLYCECEFHDDAALAAWIIDNTEAIGEALARGICTAAGKRYIKKRSDDEMERWKTIEDIPQPYRGMAQRYVDAGALLGKGGAELDITEDMVRVMEIMRRYFERSEK
nr:MAG TPA_asm: Cell wall hydrolase autolysin [Caudoviricetes sp.]